MKRIHLISGPRNISTALMYSFGNRSDCDIIDEPFYGYYLSKTKVDHPGKSRIIKKMETDSKLICKSLNKFRSSKSILFIKNMAHHIIDFGLKEISTNYIIFLIRDPAKILTSFSKVVKKPTLEDIGIKQEYLLYLTAKKSNIPSIVLDTGKVLDHPEDQLKKLCNLLHVPFDEGMLAWKAGPRNEDGIWAEYWYENVHRSTGFQKQKSSKDPLPHYLENLYLDAKYYYDLLLPHAIT